VLGGRSVRVAQLDGYRMCVDVADYLGVAPFFYASTGTLWFVPDLLDAGAVCIDAGANSGHYAFRMASLVGEGGRVFAFEPNWNCPDLVDTQRGPR
jgi:hypothetical protein